MNNRKVSYILLFLLCSAAFVTEAQSNDIINHDTKIITLDNMIYYGKYLDLNTDSISFKEGNGIDLIDMPIADVKSIQIINNGTYLVDGILWGTVFGAVSGVISWGLSSAAASTSPNLVAMDALYYIGAPTIGGAIGGLIIGLIIEKPPVKVYENGRWLSKKYKP